ncbi:MAG TPA: glycosyltransferase [Gemmatimonadales bacterium]|nr:glycosyltransferase [Gemmatimonadales bacterium]
MRGKFLFIGEEKFFIRGVTYGTFRPREDGSEFPGPEVVERDFALMRAHGVNAVRTYTVPPRWLLDAAQRHGLRLLVGLPVERHIGYLNDKKGAPDIEGLVRAGVRACAGHPAVLCYAIGNEIPTLIARWHGRSRVERYLARLYHAAKAEDPQGLVTYVNYPSTEYLQLPFLDLVCFNVFLESQVRLEAYLARLHNLAGERPLVMSEIGLDSLRHGEEAQAHALQWQIRTTFETGCAGIFLYAWTDEWYRGGADVYDWRFGLTRRDRQPKPALATVRDTFAETPFPVRPPWPRISVVVCTHNGGRTIRDCLEGLRALDYPDFEVIVVDDGSTDTSAAIAQKYDVRLIRTPNHGLSHARNIGWRTASGEIIAYLDDDAYPDPHWLTYLAATFRSTSDAGVGGPNIAPPGDGPIAECVAHAPGGPVHVLLSDREAEHIPGCNMAFRRAALEAIGGFDEQFRIAGDDVDVCWRLRHRGWRLGFSPSAVVWHHRRNSVRAYCKQQISYGRAEALLEQKWPDRYNGTGQITWAGRLYGQGVAHALAWRRDRIYHGIWGFAPFQSLYEPAPGVLESLPLMPEWYLLIAVLAALSLLGMAWEPLLLAVPPLGLATLVPLIKAGVSGWRASFPSPPRSRVAQLGCRMLTAILHVIQPLARLYGRLEYGHTPWRRRGTLDGSLPWPMSAALWGERWQDPGERLRTLETRLRADGACVLRGGQFDRWDLEVRGGQLGGGRLLMAVEEHGGGAQLVRLRWWPKGAAAAPLLVVLLAALSGSAALDEAWGVAATLGATALWWAWRAFAECAAAMAAIRRAVQQQQAGPP